jgi:hypothetical protein
MAAVWPLEMNIRDTRREREKERKREKADLGPLPTMMTLWTLLMTDGVDMIADASEDEEEDESCEKVLFMEIKTAAGEGTRCKEETVEMRAAMAERCTIRDSMFKFKKKRIIITITIIEIIEIIVIKNNLQTN